MTPSKSSGVLLVHHPRSGEQDDQVERRQLIELVERQGLGPVEYREWSDDLAPLVATDERTVVVAGGDGTVASVLLAGAGRRPPIGILPSGTANNIARCVGIDVDDLEGAARTLRAGRVRPFDLPVARTNRCERPFAESVAIGVFAETLARADQLGDLDLVHARELLSEVVTRATASAARVVADGATHEGRFLGVQVMNIDRAGPGVLLAPEADAGDGRASVVLLGESDREDLLRALRADATDDVGIAAALRERSAAVVVVECLEPAPLIVDDRLVEESPTITVTYQDRHTAPVLMP